MVLRATSGVTPAIAALANNGAIPIDPSSLKNFWKAIARQQAGTTSASNARILHIGDSTTAGLFSNGTNSGNLKLLSYPYQLAKNFEASGFAVTVDSFFSNNQFSGTKQPQVDSRCVTTGSFTTTGPLGPTLGGNTFSASAAGTIVGTWYRPADEFDVLYQTGSGYGTSSYQINGGTATNIAHNAAANVLRVRASGTLQANPTLTVNWVSGANTRIVGLLAREANRSVIEFYNAGYNSSTAQNWAATASPSDPVSTTILQLVAPDLVFLSLGINSWANPANLSAYTAAMQTIITQVQGLGNCDLILITPPPSQISFSTKANQDAYVDAMKSLASTNNVPVIDVYGYFGTMEANPTLYADNIHPNGLGYGYMADYIYTRIGSPKGSFAGYSVSRNPDGTRTLVTTNNANSIVTYASGF
jgi:lysophospholipase L1-like esterase